MSWGLEEGGVDRRGLDWEFVVSDIQTLNEWALDGRLEVTAASMHAYARVRDGYELLPRGASMGRGYGPVVVAREALSRGQLQRSEIEVPGRLDDRVPRSARVPRRRLRERELMFDRIIDEVASGRAEAGVVLHEGQLSYPRAGLVKCVDLGEWWTGETGLPLPFGVVGVRRGPGRRDRGRGVRRLPRVDRGRSRES